MADVIEEAQKPCTKCRALKPLSSFGVQRASPDGLKRWCKVCCTEHLRLWSAANPEKVKARKRRSYERNRASENAKAAVWRRSNPEKVQAAWDAWHARNPGRRQAIALDWAKRNRSALAAQAAKRRAAQKKATPIWANDELDAFVVSEAYALARVRSDVTGVVHSVDHIVPLKSGLVCGLHCAANLQVIPDTVNKSKNNRRWPQMP